ncbi:MAG: porin, partial [Bradyrhizobiaceae bacterium]
MTNLKSLILGSAAGLIAIGGAQAADLPVKAKAVEYVKVCSLYGAGFYYIPGTDTCVKIGGAIRLDVAFNGGTYDVPFWQGGAGGSGVFTQNYYSTRERINLTTDTRTATEYGVVRTYANIQFDFLQDRESIAGGYTEVDYAFIQFAG